tara:strand:- start:2761 stop:3264 length:504 start_codon:yes stop_codon:yes gene_type:complete
MKERATKHASDMDAAKTIEEKRQIELKHLDENLELDNDILKKKLESASKEESTTLKDYSSYVQGKYTLTAADISNDDDAAQNLTNAYSDLGFKFESAMPLGTQAVKMVGPKDESITVILSSPNAEQAIQNFINLYTPSETIGRLSKSGKLTKSDKKEGEVDAFGNTI